ncbi:MAG: OsmC family protein, partial [Chloroflexi bacterium]|nr:OsmC family protein [Chloroflexota bacterium]
MAERVVVHQNRVYETWLEAADPHEDASDELHPVHHALSLSPYGMLLSSLGTCTAIVLHTYAQNHGVELEDVEIRLTYGRDFQDDCEDCEEKDAPSEHIV